jgi:hypothetical protein
VEEKINTRVTDESVRAKKLADAHWNGYVSPLICSHAKEDRFYSHEEMLRLCKFHYLTAAVHFFGHGVEAERKGEFRPRIGTPLPPEEVERISGEVAPPHPTATLCHSCQRDGHCCGDYPATKDGGCEGYFSSLRERIAEAKEPQALDLSLPTIAICCTPFQILEKFKEEVEEYNVAEPGSMAQLIEAWDVIQVAQTYREHGGCSHDVETGVVVCNLQDWHGAGRPVMQAKRAMLVKNAARAMYSDKDNAAILATI